MDETIENQFNQWSLAIALVPDDMQRIQAEMQLAIVMYLYNINENISLIRDILEEKK